MMMKLKIDSFFWKITLDDLCELFPFHLHKGKKSEILTLISTITVSIDNTGN